MARPFFPDRVVTREIEIFELEYRLQPALPPKGGTPTRGFAHDKPLVSLSSVWSSNREMEVDLRIIGSYCLPPAPAATRITNDMSVRSQSPHKENGNRQQQKGDELAHGFLRWHCSAHGRPFYRRLNEGEL